MSQPSTSSTSTDPILKHTISTPISASSVSTSGSTLSLSGSQPRPHHPPLLVHLSSDDNESISIQLGCRILVSRNPENSENSTVVDEESESHSSEELNFGISVGVPAVVSDDDAEILTSEKVKIVIGSRCPARFPSLSTPSSLGNRFTPGFASPDGCSTVRRASLSVFDGSLMDRPDDFLAARKRLEEKERNEDVPSSIDSQLDRPIPIRAFEQWDSMRSAMLELSSSREDGWNDEERDSEIFRMCWFTKCFADSEMETKFYSSVQFRRIIRQSWALAAVLCPLSGVLLIVALVQHGFGQNESITSIVLVCVTCVVLGIAVLVSLCLESVRWKMKCLMVAVEIGYVVAFSVVAVMLILELQYITVCTFDVAAFLVFVHFLCYRVRLTIWWTIQLPICCVASVALCLIHHWVSNDLSYHYYETFMWLGFIACLGFFVTFCEESVLRIAFINSESARLQEGRCRSSAESWKKLLRMITLRRVVSRIDVSIPGGVKYISKASSTTMIMSDLVNFTAWSAGVTSARLAVILNDLYSRLDVICYSSGFEMLRTVGDAYIAVSMGKDLSNRSMKAVDFALSTLSVISEINSDYRLKLAARVGAAAENGTFACLGLTRPSFDCYGPVASLLESLESNAEENGILVNEMIFDLTKCEFEYGEVRFVGIGDVMETLAFPVVRRRLSMPSGVGTTENIQKNEDTEDDVLSKPRHSTLPKVHTRGASSLRLLLFGNRDLRLFKAELLQGIVCFLAVATFLARILFAADILLLHYFRNLHEDAPSPLGPTETTPIAMTFVVAPVELLAIVTVSLVMGLLMKKNRISAATRSYNRLMKHGTMAMIGVWLLSSKHLSLAIRMAIALLQLVLIDLFCHVIFVGNRPYWHFYRVVFSLAFALALFFPMLSHQKNLLVAMRNKERCLENLEKHRKLRGRLVILLRSLLPDEIIERVSADESGHVSFDMVGCVAFLKVVGWPEQDRGDLVWLGRLYAQFDTLIENSTVEKVKSIRTTYLVYCRSQEGDHPSVALSEIVDFCCRCNGCLRKAVFESPGFSCSLRFTGAVIGSSKMSFDLFGATVNLAARMYQTGVNDHLQMTARCGQFLLDGETKLKPRAEQVAQSRVMGQRRLYLDLGRSILKPFIEEHLETSGWIYGSLYSKRDATGWMRIRATDDLTIWCATLAPFLRSSQISRLCISSIESDSSSPSVLEFVPRICGELREKGVSFQHVMGPREIVEKFAESRPSFREIRGLRLFLATRETLSEPRRPIRVADEDIPSLACLSHRLVQDTDQDQLVGLFRQNEFADVFYLGLPEEDRGSEAVQTAKNWIENKRAMFLVKSIGGEEEIVSTVCFRDVGGSLYHVSGVFTPLKYQRRGLASWTVYWCCSKLLREEGRKLSLFTDAGNPTSNHIYQSIGFRFVGDFAHFGESNPE